MTSKVLTCQMTADTAMVLKFHFDFFYKEKRQKTIFTKY